MPLSFAVAEVVVVVVVVAVRPCAPALDEKRDMTRCLAVSNKKRFQNERGCPRIDDSRRRHAWTCPVPPPRTTSSRSPCPVVPITAVRPSDGRKLAVSPPSPFTRRLVPGSGMRIARDDERSLREGLGGRRGLVGSPGSLWQLLQRPHAGTAKVGAIAGTLAHAAPPTKKGLRGSFGRTRTRYRGLARRSCSGTYGRARTCWNSK